MSTMAQYSAYGTCDGGRGGRNSLDEPPPDRDDRGCNTLSFKRFSRSVRLASQAVRRDSLTGTIDGASGAYRAPSPAKEDTPIVPPPPRLWHHTSNDVIGLLEMVKESAVLLSLLFLTSAIAFTSVQLSWGPTAVFSLCFFALIPLAVLLGDLTEALSGWCGPTAGGLLNATLGNATEAIVLVQAVRHRLVGVEQAALLGGVLSNMLLVVGLSFIVGGVATKGPQSFDRRVTAADIGVLLVSVVAVTLPSIAASAPGGSERDTLADSRSTALVLLLMYGAFLVYTLSPAPPPSENSSDVEASATHKTAAASGGGDDDKDEQPSMSFWTILGLLGLITVLMAFLSNSLVVNVFPVSAALQITPDLVSCIFLPIIGNIAELGTALIAARRGAVDLSLAVALGSSTQISLFLLPMAALFGWAIDVPFSFDFAPTFASAFFASVVVVALVVMDGEANWLKGCMLVGTYIVFAVGLLTNAGAAGVGGPASAPEAAPIASTA